MNIFGCLLSILEFWQASRTHQFIFQNQLIWINYLFVHNLVQLIDQIHRLIVGTYVKMILWQLGYSNGKLHFKPIMTGIICNKIFQSLSSIQYLLCCVVTNE